MKYQLDQSRLPLCDVLTQYAKEDRVRLSMPGHKGGHIDTPLTKAWGAALWQWDVTELAMTDQLYHAQGCLLEAQQLLADFLGAEQAFFLVNGASAGLMAGILSVIKPGERILVPRNAHGSIWRGVALAGAEAVVMPVGIDETWQIPLGIDVNQVETVIKAYAVKAMVVVYPTYHGLYGDMAALISICKKYQVKLVVDMAHGGHLPFLPGRIPNPIELGADIVIQGWHKTMGSMTQTAVAAVQNETLTFGQNLLYFQSTSPSYPLMSSLDGARALWAVKGCQFGQDLAVWAAEFTQAIHQVTGWRTLDSKDFAGPVWGKDCTKILLVNDFGLSGFVVADYLSEMGIDVEMAEEALVTIILAIGDLPQKERIISRVTAALEQIRHKQQGVSVRENHLAAFLPSQEVAVLAPRPWWSMSCELVPYGEAIGMVAAEMVSLYPPGIPLLLPGQEITEKEIAILEQMILAGGSVQGCDNGVIRVLTEAVIKK
ncbi:MAG: aminotransferase class I/II-fold pyridoxal phosphate-dependent enzyme [Peptococcaceae bacterium]|nr:aminotransferase class I/II-fold pyridoxal phosphate-dependent enzyme [Peptococcaceae bacterium]